MLSEEILSSKHRRAETSCYQGTLTVEQDASHDNGQRIQKREVAVDAAGEIDDGRRKAEVTQNLKVSLPHVVGVESQQRKMERGDNEDPQSRPEQTLSRIGVYRGRLYTQDHAQQRRSHDDSKLYEP